MNCSSRSSHYNVLPHLFRLLGLSSSLITGFILYPTSVRCPVQKMNFEEFSAKLIKD
jgi:hypothetical protein